MFGDASLPQPSPCLVSLEMPAPVTSIMKPWRHLPLWTVWVTRKISAQVWALCHTWYYTYAASFTCIINCRFLGVRVWWEVFFKRATFSSLLIFYKDTVTLPPPPKKNPRVLYLSQSREQSIFILFWRVRRPSCEAYRIRPWVITLGWPDFW